MSQVSGRLVVQVNPTESTVNRLEKFRRGGGYSYRALADEIGLASYQTLFHYCRNGVRPQGLNRRALEAYFGKSAEQLLKPAGTQKRATA